jgi:nitrile hydratase accessory protein
LNPPDRPPGEPVFREPWEAQTFAMAVSLHEKGFFNWKEWADVLGREIAAGGERSYYEFWLSALERIVEAKCMMSESERLARIDEWDHAARMTPHGKPIELRKGA